MKLMLAFAVIFTVGVESGRRRRRESPQCEQRCARIYQRSLQRMETDAASVLTLIDPGRSREVAKQACWKFYDSHDCMQHCEVTNKAQWKKTSRSFKAKCSAVLEGNEPNFACISKFHSFLEVRCSGYMDEALRIHSLSQRDPSLEQETCRYLHYHSLCLDNNIIHFCPGAKKVFTRLNLRDFFLSFVLPEDDKTFSDEFLDYCQLYDFVKAVQDVYAENDLYHFAPSTSTSSNQDASLTAVTNPDKQLESPATTTVLPSTQRPVVYEHSVAYETAVTLPTTSTSIAKILFSPDRDLLQTPPNFYYSSQRYGLAARPTLYPSVSGNVSKEEYSQEYADADEYLDDEDDEHFSTHGVAAYDEERQYVQPTHSSIHQSTTAYHRSSTKPATPQPTVITNSGEVAYVHAPDHQLQNTTTNVTLDEILRRALQTNVITPHVTREGASRDVAKGAIALQRNRESSDDSSLTVSAEDAVDSESSENSAGLLVGKGDVNDVDEHYIGNPDMRYSAAHDYNQLHSHGFTDAGTLDSTEATETSTDDSSFEKGSMAHERAKGRNDLFQQNKLTAISGQASQSTADSREANKSKTRKPPILDGHRVHVKPIRSWKDSHAVRSAEKHDDETSHEKASYSTSNEGPAKDDTSAAWDDVYDISPNANIDRDTEGDAYEPAGQSSERARSYGDEPLARGRVSDGEDVNTAGKTKNGQSDHHEVMIIVYGILVSVAFITVTALLIMIALRKHLS